MLADGDDRLRPGGDIHGYMPPPPCGGVMFGKRLELRVDSREGTANQ
jgi:hypothetical protein